MTKKQKKEIIQESGEVTQEAEEVIRDSESQLAANCQEYLAGWQRAKADYENLQKSLEERMSQARAQECAVVVSDLLPVLDTLEQAFANQPQVENQEVQSWLEGVKLAENQLQSMLERFDVSEITIDGQFDPEVHEAVGVQNDSELPDGAVVQVLQKGWRLGDKVIRAAKVIVNRLET